MAVKRATKEREEARKRDLLDKPFGGLFHGNDAPQRRICQLLKSMHAAILDIKGPVSLYTLAHECEELDEKLLTDYISYAHYFEPHKKSKIFSAAARMEDRKSISYVLSAVFNICSLYLADKDGEERARKDQQLYRIRDLFELLKRIDSKLTKEKKRYLLARAANLVTEAEYDGLRQAYQWEYDKTERAKNKIIYDDAKKVKVFSIEKSNNYKRINPPLPPNEDLAENEPDRYKELYDQWEPAYDEWNEVHGAPDNPTKKRVLRLA